MIRRSLGAQSNRFVQHPTDVLREALDESIEVSSFYHPRLLQDRDYQGASRYPEATRLNSNPEVTHSDEMALSEWDQTFEQLEGLMLSDLEALILSHDAG